VARVFNPCLLLPKSNGLYELRIAHGLETRATTEFLHCERTAVLVRLQIPLIPLRLPLVGGAQDPVVGDVCWFGLYGGDVG
jgi:hypothetical protein